MNNGVRLNHYLHRVGCAVRITDLSGQHDLHDPVLSHWGVLVLLDHGHHVHTDGHDRNTDPDRGGGEQRYRTDRSRESASPGRPVAGRRTGPGRAGTASSDPHDRRDNGAGSDAIVHWNDPDRRRRSALFPDGARNRRRVVVFDLRQPRSATHYLYVARYHPALATEIVRMAGSLVKARIQRPGMARTQSASIATILIIN